MLDRLQELEEHTMLSGMVKEMVNDVCRKSPNNNNNNNNDDDDDDDDDEDDGDDDDND